MVKTIFIGLFYFGLWHGWEMETKIFPTYDDCLDHLLMVEDLGLPKEIKRYKLSCHLPTVNGDTGGIIIEKNNNW